MARTARSATAKAATGSAAPSARITKTKRESQRVAVLVIGMHRSGTSALTRVLNQVGCDLPARLIGGNQSNQPGHWESESVARFNDRLLESAGTSWDDWLEFNPRWISSPKADAFRAEVPVLVEQEFGASRLFVLKDPRICRMADFWIDALESASIRPVVILPLRNPLEVAASLKARNGFDFSLGMLMWLRHVLDAEHATRSVPRFFTSFDDLMSNWARMLERAQQALGVDWPRLSNQVHGEIEGFLSQELRHHREAPENLTENPAVSHWLRDTFDIMRDWARSGEKPADRARLDTIRAEFNAASPAFARIVEKAQTTEVQAKQLDQKLAQTEKKLRDVEATAQQGGEKAQALAGQLEDVRKTAAEHSQAAEKLKASLEKLRAESQAAAAAKDEAVAKLEAAISGHEKRKAEIEQALTAERKTRAEIEQEIVKLRADGNDQGKKLAQVAEEKVNLTKRLGEVEASAKAERERRQAAEGALQRAEAESAALVNRLEAQLKDSAERAKAAEALNETLVQHGEERGAEDAKTRARLADLTTQLADSGTRRDAAEAELKRVRVEIESLRSQAAKTDAERTQLATRLETIEGQLSEARAETKRFSEAVREADQRMATVQAQLAEAQARAQSAVQGAEATAAAILQVENEKADLATRFAELEKRLAEASEQQDKARQERDRLHQELESRAREMAEARDTVGRLRDDLGSALQRLGNTEEARRQLERAVADLEAAIAARQGRLDEALAHAQAEAERARLGEEAAAGLERELAARLEDLGHAGEKLSNAQGRISEMEALAGERLEWGRQLESGLEARLQEVEGLRGLVEQGASELQQAQARIDAQAGEISILQGEAERHGAQAARAESDLRELRHKLAQTESALAQRRHEAEETGAELEAVRRELQNQAALQEESEKLTSGFREHVSLLIQDLQERQAALADMEAASRSMRQQIVSIEAERAALATSNSELQAQLSRTAQTMEETTHEINSVRQTAKRLEEELALKVEERKTMSAQLSEAESRLDGAFQEIATLSQLLAQREAADGEARVRQVAAQQLGRTVMALLAKNSWSLLPARMRVRRQMAAVQRSGLFDPEWYLQRYEDVSKSGMDPLMHYVVHGAAEGREPNGALGSENT